MWAKEAKYLGVYIVAGLTFNSNFDKAKIKYYRSCKWNFGKGWEIKTILLVSLKPILSIALSVLLYSIASCTFE